MKSIVQFIEDSRPKVRESGLPVSLQVGKGIYWREPVESVTCILDVINQRLGVKTSE
jgi:hypothetical protein